MGGAPYLGRGNAGGGDAGGGGALEQAGGGCGCIKGFACLG